VANYAPYSYVLSRTLQGADKALAAIFTHSPTSFFERAYFFLPKQWRPVYIGL
jgi:hypothetical protein